jgi:hypothetical protein
MMERAKHTGDPLGYQAGMIDVGRLVHDAVTLSMPSAQSRGIRIKVGSSVSVVLSGDQRLLLEAMDTVIDLALRCALPECTMAVGIELRSGSASIELVVPVEAQPTRARSVTDCKGSNTPLELPTMSAEQPKRVA